MYREETGICWRNHAIALNMGGSRRVFCVNTVAPVALQVGGREHCAMSRQDDDKAARLRRDGCHHPAPGQVTDNRFDDMTFHLEQERPAGGSILNANLGSNLNWTWHLSIGTCGAPMQFAKRGTRPFRGHLGTPAP